MFAFPKFTAGGAGRDRLVSIALRCSFATAFGFPPIAAWLRPEAWVGFIPAAIRDVVPDDYLFLHAFGAFELILVVWVLFGKNVRVPALLGALLLVAIMASHAKFPDIVFRDFALLFAMVALAARGR